MRIERYAHWIRTVEGEIRMPLLVVVDLMLVMVVVVMVMMVMVLFAARLTVVVVIPVRVAAAAGRQLHRLVLRRRVSGQGRRFAGLFRFDLHRLFLEQQETTRLTSRGHRKNNNASTTTTIPTPVLSSRTCRRHGSRAKRERDIGNV